HASGRLDTLEELARSVPNIRKTLRYLGPNWRAGSVLSGKAIGRLIEDHLGDLTFADLDTPTVLVASDLISGETVLLDKGPVREAIHATIALPGIFTPVVRDHQVLIDGGAVMPVPVRPARALAPDLPVVAVNLQGDYAARRKTVGISDMSADKLRTIGVIRAATGLMLSGFARQQLALDPPDLEIVMPVGHIDPSNFTRAGELIRIGRETAEAAIDDIRALTQQN
ncbi:MAG: patatin-like phospholipase family protein, partial [Parasphingopyxis sp.]|nr:patatin-like phospholipase family protein [Sphingomonadales bacterium]